MHAGFALIVLVAAGFVSNVCHFRGQFDNYNSRVVTIPDALLASEPAVTSQKILFTAMLGPGYGIRQLRAGAVTKAPNAGGNWFHPAAIENDPEGWAEQSSQAGSRIVRFLSDDASKSAAPFSIEAENAEQPAVSQDGKWLAFVREVHGKGSLWIQQLGSGTLNELPREIAGPDHDVREAAFAPNNRMVFSARSQGRFGLYESTMAGDVQEIRDTKCSARYPAISPNGQWMAYSCEQGGNWQLHAMNLRTREEMQLTRAECNCTNPAWTTDSKRLIYATDCGRGLGLTALAEIRMIQ
jgi:hypothetical protein